MSFFIEKFAKKPTLLKGPSLEHFLDIFLFKAPLGIYLKLFFTLFFFSRYIWELFENFFFTLLFLEGTLGVIV